MNYYRVKANHGARVTTRTILARNAADAYTRVARDIENFYGQTVDDAHVWPCEAPLPVQAGGLL